MTSINKLAKLGPRHIKENGNRGLEKRCVWWSRWAALCDQLLCISFLEQWTHHGFWAASTVSHFNCNIRPVWMVNLTCGLTCSLLGHVFSGPKSWYCGGPQKLGQSLGHGVWKLRYHQEMNGKTYSFIQCYW